MRRKHTITVLTLLVATLLMASGCDRPSKAERKAAADASWEQEQKVKADTKKLEIQQISEKFNAVYFPPATITDASYTYELQQYFEVHARKKIVFKAYIKDIKQVENEIVVDFIHDLGSYITYKPVTFSLVVDKETLDVLLKGKRTNPLFMSYAMAGNTYYVVAGIDEVRTSLLYTFEGSGGESSTVDPNVTDTVIVTGRLFRAEEIPKK